MKLPTELSQLHLVEQIYTLAKTSDEAGIRLLMTEACLGVSRGHNTAIELLARAGEAEAVYFLINKFNGSIHEAVQGAASGNHLSLLKELLRRGASLNFALIGAGYAGNFTLIRELIKYGGGLEYAWFGAGIGGRRELFTLLDTLKDCLDYGVRGAALAGNVKDIDYFLKMGALIDWAMIGAGHSNNKELASILLARGGNLKFCISGAAMGGHINMINDLVNIEDHLNTLVYGAAVGGHYKMVKFLLSKGAAVKCLIRGLAPHPQMELINNFIKKPKAIKCAITYFNPHRYLKEYELALKLITFTTNKDLRSSFAETVHKNEKKINPTVLLKLAKKLNYLMKGNQLDYHEARAWKLNLHFWFLQGKSALKMPMEIFILISMFIVDLTYKETETLFFKHRNVMAAKLFDASKKSIEKKYHSINPLKKKMTNVEYVQEHANASIRYANRIAYNAK